jgi:predicted N-acetyltransferase YhbS
LGLRSTVSAPEPLAGHHQLGEFGCGVVALDDWLKRRAHANQATGASRTFVVCEANEVIGYYTLAAGAVNIGAAPGRFRRNMPDPIPVVLLARLAVDRAHHARGIGRALFRDGAMRVAQAADAIGIRGILVHAISGDAKAFYLALGFEPSPVEPMTLMVSLADVRRSLE